MSSKPEPVIWSHDIAQKTPCFDSCQLTITWIFNIKARLDDLALGGVWPPCSSWRCWEHAHMIHVANLVEKKELSMVFYFYACGCLYSYGALICGSQQSSGRKQ